MTLAALVAVGLLLALSLGSALIVWAACALAGQIEDRFGVDE